jgi:3-methyl-2-oxobutanoate hydroxymethyltransferase
MAEMIHHAKAANRAVKQALLIGDMPFESYQANSAQALDNALRFVQEAGCNAVKLEWFDRCLEVTGKIVQAGIPVMGHIGLTPQTAEQLGGFKVQGKDADSAAKIIEYALALEKSGCFSIVLECIPSAIAKMITDQLTIPTIGIGAGPDCDGQVLVIHDLIGLFDRFKPKFVKQYTDASTVILEGIKSFCKEVGEGKFPDPLHSYSMNPDELARLKRGK